jgi:hypothetical protein
MWTSAGGLQAGQLLKFLIEAALRRGKPYGRAAIHVMLNAPKSAGKAR